MIVVYTSNHLQAHHHHHVHSLYVSAMSSLKNPGKVSNTTNPLDPVPLIAVEPVSEYSKTEDNSVTTK